MSVRNWLLVAIGVLLAALAVAIAWEAWVAAAIVVVLLGVWLAAWLTTIEDGPSPAWIAGLLFILAVTGAAVVFEIASEERTGPEECADAYVNPVLPGPQGRTAPRPIPTGGDGAEEADPELSFQFGHTSSAIIRRQAFTAEGAEAEKFGFALLADVTDEKTGNDLPLGTIKGKIAGVSVLRGGVRLSVCIDPEPADEPRINPGSYEGSVSVGTHGAPRRALTSIPITVTVGDDQDWIAMAAVLIGVIAGLVVRAAGDLAQATGRRPDDEEDDRQEGDEEEEADDQEGDEEEGDDEEGDTDVDGRGPRRATPRRAMCVIRSWSPIRVTTSTRCGSS